MSKILLVEDNLMNRDMLSRRLARRGFEVVLAIDGNEAIEKAQTDAPDLILMDLHLPGVNGWDATRIIKADTRTAKIPVVALTAHAMLNDRDKALAAGCDDWATKPVEFDKLIEKIQAFLGAN
jgi:CheY-like chemotaxis protein